MATRPWVTPQDVKEYSIHTEVQNRTDARLAVDIVRAEQQVIAYTRNNFSTFTVIPENVRLAVILIAERFALNAEVSAQNGRGGNFKSEKFDDYSYTIRDRDSELEGIDLGPLLDDYIIGSPAGADVFLRMRKL